MRVCRDDEARHESQCRLRGDRLADDVGSKVTVHRINNCLIFGISEVTLTVYDLILDTNAGSRRSKCFDRHGDR